MLPTIVATRERQKAFAIAMEAEDSANRADAT